MFDVMPNASNTSGVRAAIGGVDTTAARAVIAVQGPDARANLVASVFPEAAAVGPIPCRHVYLERGVVCRRRHRLHRRARSRDRRAERAAGALWRALATAGIAPAGLGARDTLRLEAALPLHGHELGPGITSLQAGLGWVVAWDKPEFTGRDAAIAERERASIAPARRHRHRGSPARHGPECTGASGRSPVGVVTSGNFSPVLGHGIALAFLPPGHRTGRRSGHDRRPRQGAPGTVVPTPFVTR